MDLNTEITNFYKHEVDAEKLYMVVDSPEVANFIASNLPEELYMIVSFDNLAMIMNKEATKSKAVSALAKYWGIEKSEVVAFGDDKNDIDLLKYAGIGIAMGNALPEVKEIADQICGTNDEDGLANWITDNIL